MCKGFKNGIAASPRLRRALYLQADTTSSPGVFPVKVVGIKIFKEVDGSSSFLLPDKNDYLKRWQSETLRSTLITQPPITNFRVKIPYFFVSRSRLGHLDIASHKYFSRDDEPLTFGILIDLATKVWESVPIALALLEGVITKKDWGHDDLAS